MAALRLRALLGISCRQHFHRFSVVSRRFTEQVFEDGDYRKIRHIDRQKEVNEQFAINLIDEEPPKAVATTDVWCDGGDPSLGHPKVYINLDKPGPHACGYCGLRYFHKGQ